MNKEYKPTEEDLTAYALGEADDNQASMIEAALESQPESRALLDEIREAVELSEAAFAELKDEALTEEQRAKVESAAGTVVAAKFPKKRKYWVVEGLVAAACVAILSGFVVAGLSEFRAEEGFDVASVGENVNDSPTGVRAADDSAARSSEEWSYAEELQQVRDEVEEYRASVAEIDRRRLESAEQSEAVVSESLAIGIPAGEAAPKPVVTGRIDSVDPNAGASLVVADGEVREVDADDTSLTTSAPPKPEPEQQILASAIPQGGRTAGSGEAAPESVRRQQLARGNQRPDINLYNEPNSADGLSTLPTVQTESLAYAGDSVAPPPATGAVVEEQVARRVSVVPQQTVVGVEMKMTTPTAPGQDRFYVAGQPADSYGWEYAPQRPGIQPVPTVPVTPGTEAYERIVENTFKRVSDAPLSTFSIDVDTASYANVRRFLNQAQLPPADAVRVEELINYFDYDYPRPVGEDPFSANIEVAQSPWSPQHKLVRVGLKGKDIAVEERPATNLVFLLDVSGSMNQPNKLPLLKQSLRLLTEQLGENDRVAIAVYSGNSGLVLNSTPGNMHNQIIDALNRLQAGGSTNGGAGIQLAYDIATQNFIPGGVNRVILATDGDFNVGVTSRDSLVNLIENKAKSGVFLSVLGFGMGNLKDATMEKLADKGNGNYAYIDTFSEAKKVLADEMSGTLFTIAKDVKIQVEFNPSRVQAYRLIGYENRALADRDFNDDTKDAGEIGAGHTVTALYEVVPTGVALTTNAGVDQLRYQTPAPAEQARAAIQPDVDPAVAAELLTVKLRYKQPEGNTSKLLEFPVRDVGRGYAEASTDFKFATAVAAFGMKLRNSPFAYTMTYDTVLSIAESGVGSDLNGYRAEFLGLVRQARSLSPQVTQRRY